MSKRTAIVLGPTGLIGNHLLNLLLTDTDYEKVKVFHRRRVLKIHDKMEHHEIDLDKLERMKAQFNGNDVFCCLGTTMKKAGSKEAFKKVDHDYPVKAAGIAYENGVENFLLVSAIGADKDSRFFYNQVKGEVEEDIISKKVSSVYIFRPSILEGERNEIRIGEKVGLIVMKGLSFLMWGKFKKYRPIKGETVAEAMIKKAKSGETGVHIYESAAIKKIAAS